jgi:hypothetical protein
VAEKEGRTKMENRKRILLVGFFVSLIFVLIFVNSVGATTKVYYGQVIGIEFTMLQVRDEDGRVSVFWCGYKTFLDSRPPLIGDRVKIEYIKDSIWRNAVTRIAVVK